MRDHAVRGWAMQRLSASAVVALLLSAKVLAVPPLLGGPLVDGSVVRTRGCGAHFFIAYRDEFVLAEWLGGEMIKDNDVLQITDDRSSFEREGRITLTNLTTGGSVEAMIEQALMNRAAYTRLVGQVCR